MTLPQKSGNIARKFGGYSSKMCNNATKQEILVLIALKAHSGPVSEDQIIGYVGHAAERVGWPRYLDHLPSPIHEMCKSFELEGIPRAKRLKTQYWQATDNTGPHLEYLIDTHAPQAMRETLRELAQELA